MRFMLFIALPWDTLWSDARNSSAKIGCRRLWIELRYVAKGTRAALREVWFPSLTEGS